MDTSALRLHGPRVARSLHLCIVTVACRTQQLFWGPIRAAEACSLLHDVQHTVRND